MNQRSAAGDASASAADRSSRQPPPAAREPIVRLEGCSKSYDQAHVVALDRVDLEIFPGEFFSLLGPSGSGKTTTLRLIAGFEMPDRGRVHIDGADVTELRPYHRNVNTVFQSYALFPHMTVSQNVAYPLKMKRLERGEIGRRVSEALALVDMTGYDARLPHQLSGGQRQRIALARALVAHPRVVLLDEPLGALDLKLRQQMQLVLKELQREVDITFVYVTHDQGEALSMSDRLAVINAGRIEQLGTPEEIYYRPDTRFVADFIGRSNLIDCRIERAEDGRSIARHGDVRLSLSGEHDPGEATLAIRCEAVRLGATGERAAGENRLQTVVRQVIFHGEAREVVLDIGGVQLAAISPTKRGAGPHQGERLEVAIDSTDVVVIRG